MKAAWLVVFLVGCGPSYIDAVDLAPTTLASGLIAHWTFDETDGTLLADDSDNRRNGTLSGGTITDDGRFSGALHLRPGESVTVENFPYAKPSWSFSAWVRVRDEDVDPEDFGTVVSTEAMPQGGWEFQTRPRASGVYWTFAYWVGPGIGYAHYECRRFTFGQWSHATVVIDAALNLLSFYVDGKLEQSGPIPAPIRAGTSALYMGKWLGAGRLFSGSIDDVAIYDRALLAREVEELDMRPPPRPR